MENKNLLQYWDEAKNIFSKRRERGTPEFPTGFSFIDEATDGLHRGELWYIGAKSGVGKTIMALNMAQSFADNPQHSVLFFSLEMQGWELATRMFCDTQDIEYDYFLRGLLPPAYKEKEKQFRKYLSSLDFEIYEAGYTFEEIIKTIKTDYHGSKPDVIFIDFIQLTRSIKYKDRQTALEEYAYRLKELAKTEKIGIVAVSQFHRPFGDVEKEPRIEFLKGSGGLEQSADRILLIWKKEDTMGNKNYYINMAKARMARNVKREVIFEGNKYRFKEMPLLDIEKKVRKTFGE